MRTSLRATLFAAVALGAPFAAAHCAHAASTVVGNGLAHNCYAAAKAGRGDLTALRDCDAAIGDTELNAHDRTATVVNRGIIHLLRREADAALADFDLAISWAPNVGEAHVNRGAALILKADYTGAIAAIDRGLELGSDEPQDAYFNRAVANEKLDRIPAAYRLQKGAGTEARLGVAADGADPLHRGRAAIKRHRSTHDEAPFFRAEKGLRAARTDVGAYPESRR